MTISTGLLAGRVIRAAVIAGSIGVGSCQPDLEPNGSNMPGVPLSIGTDLLLGVGGLRDDGNPEFHQLALPSLLPDGRLLVPARGDREIHLFGTDGTRLASFGRPGQGPGEFEGLVSAWARGDTIEALDLQLRRITRFFPDNSIEVVTLGQAGGMPLGVPGILDDGWVLTRLVASDPGSREQIVVDHFALDGTHLREIARAEGRKRYALPSGTSVEPLSPDAVFAMRAGTLYVGDTLIPGIRMIDLRTLQEEEAGGRITRSDLLRKQ